MTTSLGLSLMLRFIFRTIAVLCLALSIMFIVIDATRSIGASVIVFTALSESWLSFAPVSYAALGQWADQSAPAFVNDPILVNLLELPTFCVSAVLSAIFYLIGYKRRGRPGQFLEN